MYANGLRASIREIRRDVPIGALTVSHRIGIGRILSRESDRK
jgi:hypothetical protein